MKRVIIFLLTIIVIYVVYFDLSNGTLPSMSEQITSAKIDNQELPYFEEEVQHGDTVISIVEKHLDASIPVSIQKVVDDFKELNNGVNPEDIQFGKMYKFPDYKSN